MNEIETSLQDVTPKLLHPYRYVGMTPSEQRHYIQHLKQKRTKQMRKALYASRADKRAKEKEEKAIQRSLILGSETAQRIRYIAGLKTICTFFRIMPQSIKKNYRSRSDANFLPRITYIFFIYESIGLSQQDIQDYIGIDRSGLTNIFRTYLNVISVKDAKVYPVFRLLKPYFSGRKIMRRDNNRKTFFFTVLDL